MDTITNGTYNARKTNDTFRGLMGTGENTGEVITDLDRFFKEKAGFNYGVDKVPAYDIDPISGLPVAVPNQFHLRRDTDGKVVSPSTVTDRYHPIVPDQVLDNVRWMVDQGWATPDAGFIMNDGQKEVYVLRLDGGSLENEGSVGGERHVHYAALRNGYGGTAISGSVVSWRLVCENTIAAAFMSDVIDFRIPHTKSANKRMETEIQRWEKIRREIQVLCERMGLWMEIPISHGEAIVATDKILGIDRGAKVSGQKRNLSEAVMGAFKSEANATAGETVYDLFQAVTWLNSHYKSPTSKLTERKRVESMVDERGTRAVRERKALSILGSIVTEKTDGGILVPVS